MTREEILAMKPGRELNKAVAETLFGMQGLHLMNEFLPEYSETIPAAWEAEEKIKQLRLHVKYCEALKKVVLSTGEYVGLFDYIHATPAQRCKAALLAVMDKEAEAK